MDDTWRYLLASLQSVGTVAVVVCLGAMLGRKGYLDKPARGAMAGLVMRVGYPTLVFTRLLDCPQCLVSEGEGKECPPCSTAIDYVKEAWFVMLVPLIFIGLGLIVGKQAADISGCPECLRCACMVAVACPNYFGMPLVVLDTLGGELVRLGVLTRDPVTYIAVLNLTAEVLVWTVGSFLLEVKPEGAKDVEKIPGGGQKDFEAVHIESDTDCDGGAHAGGTDYWSAVKELVRLFFSLPPVLAVLAAVAVALADPWVPLCSLLVDRSQQDQAPLKFVFHAFKVCGGLMVPLNLLVLGSNLSNGVDFSKMPRRACVGVAFSKLIAMPLLMCCVVCTLSRILPPQHPEVWIIALLEGCTPTANSVATMVELSGKNSEAMSTAIAVQYYIAPVTIAGWLTVFSGMLKSEWLVAAP